MSGAFHVELPPSTAAKEALYSYLYQMAEQLNAALAQMPGDTLTQTQTKAVQEIAGSEQVKQARPQRPRQRRSEA